MLLIFALILIAMIILIRLCIWPLETTKVWESELPIGSYIRRPNHPQASLTTVFRWTEYGTIDNDSEKEHEIHIENVAEEESDEVMQGVEVHEVFVWTRAGYLIDPEHCLSAWIVERVQAIAAARRRNGGGH